MTGAPLPELVDRKRLQLETGLGRAAVDGIFRALPVTTIPNVRKVFVKRSDVERFLDENTHRPGSVRP